MLLIVVFISAVACGFFSSTPIGPINLVVINAVAERRFSVAPPFITGVILADVVLVGLVMFGFFELKSWKDAFTNLGVCGAGAIIFFGCYEGYRTFFSASAGKNPTLNGLSHTLHEDLETLSLRRRLERSCLGFLLCFLNPGFLIYWVAAVGLITALVPMKPSLLTTFVFAGGVAFGDLLWFMLLIWMSKKLLTDKKDKTLQFVRAGASSLMVIMGIVTLVKII